MSRIKNLQNTESQLYRNRLELRLKKEMKTDRECILEKERNNQKQQERQRLITRDMNHDHDAAKRWRKKEKTTYKRMKDERKRIRKLEQEFDFADAMLEQDELIMLQRASQMLSNDQ